MAWYDEGDAQELVVPDAVIHRVRTFVSDLPELNRVAGGQVGKEATDDMIRLGVRMFISHFNAIPPPLNVTYTIDNFPNISLFLRGVTVEVLMMVGMLHTRNSIPYSDQGLQIDLWSKSQEWSSWAQGFQARVDRDLMSTKIALNAKEFQGTVVSPDFMDAYGWEY